MLRLNRGAVIVVFEVVDSDLRGAKVGSAAELVKCKGLKRRQVGIRPVIISGKTTLS
jgi:hypothetical protein